MSFSIVDHQIHGASRLGGNGLLDTLVFGKIAGREASVFAKQLQTIQEDNPLESKVDIDVQKFEKDLFYGIG